MDTTVSAHEETLAWLRLTLVPSMKRDAQRALLNAFGSPVEATRASPQVIAKLIGEPAAQSFVAGPRAALIDATLRWLAPPRCSLVVLGEAPYPKAFLNIADPPTAFYAQGRVDLLNAPAFAIVGSRNATPQGLRDAQAIALELSQAGLTIASGMAIGIDAAAHRGGPAREGARNPRLRTRPP